MGPKSLAAWQSHYCMWNSVPGLPSSCLLYPAGAADLSSLLLIVKWGIFIKLIKIQIHLSHWPASHFLLVLFMEETRILSETQAPPSASLSVPSCGGHSSVLRQWDAYPSTGPLRRKAFPDLPEEASFFCSRPFCSFSSSFCSYSCWLAPWFTDPH